MKPLHIALALTLSAALPGMTAHASEHRKHAREADRPARGMQVVAVAPGVGEPGHGWQYFSDPRKARAVVISPDGDYYYSHGNGPRLVYRAGAAT